MLIRIPKGWELPERDAASEEIFRNRRRRFLKTAGVAGMAGAAAAWGLTQRTQKVTADEPLPDYPPLPAPRNDRYIVDRPVP